MPGGIPPGGIPPGGIPASAAPIAAFKQLSKITHVGWFKQTYACGGRLP